MKVVGIAGSSRKNSDTLKAIGIALESAGKAGAEVELIDLCRIKLPLYEPDQDLPPVAREVIGKVERAQALILGSPVYHGSMSGALKNMLDYLTSLDGKAVALLSVSGGYAGTSTITSLQFVVHSLHGILLPSSAAISDLSPPAQKRLERMGTELVRLSTRLDAFQAGDSMDPRPA